MLDSYVEMLADSSLARPDRVALRTRFYRNCRDAEVSSPMVSCTGPVGIGKTTAVLAYLLKTAARENLDRIIIVAPFTNIIDQTVANVRKAIVLPGEEAGKVVAAHHHQAEYESLESRSFATQWTAPIVVTTAVQFFGTLSANKPGALRKLQSIPGSAVFLDEAHAAIPVRLWQQNWLWLSELSQDWGCHFVFASGSLIEFWNIRKIVGSKTSDLPAIDTDVIAQANSVEKQRVKYSMLPEALSRQSLVHAVQHSAKPALVILNTVQSAAVIASELRETGEDVLHISTALCPSDRESILRKIKQRLSAETRIRRQNRASKEDLQDSRNWILVSTSCMEAGVDLSFRTAFREAASTASAIQVGGRVNRHSERELGEVIVFRLIKDGLINEHPDFKIASVILAKAFASGDFDGLSPSEIATKAMKEELKQLGQSGGESLQAAEEERDYPLVSKLGRVIDSDTRTVVVSPEMVQRLDGGERPSFRDLQSASVQLWSRKIADLGLDTAKPFSDVYVWRGPYDPTFLGIMKGMLQQRILELSGYGIV
jgi:CRISPR-associated endonuclease/helicase Cas3